MAQPSSIAAQPARRAYSRRLGWWLRQIQAQPLAAFGAFLVLAWVVIAIISPWIAPYNPLKQDYANLQAPPTALHPFGTDNFGRDILSRVLLGSRSVLALAGLSTLASLICGTIIALVAGYYGGVVDEILMRFADAAMALPAVLLALLILAMVGPGNVSIFASTVIVFSPLVARVVRSAALPLVDREFIAAAKLRGERGPSIMVRELLPNLLGVLAVEGSIRLGYAIFLIASLGFLGVGVQPPTPDWGLMISEAQQYATQSPWMVIFPALAVSTLVIGINLVSDGVKQLVTALEQRGSDEAEPVASSAVDAATSALPGEVPFP
jgi:peptide/nickel transport system permease protein